MLYYTAMCVQPYSIAVQKIPTHGTHIWTKFPLDLCCCWTMGFCRGVLRDLRDTATFARLYFSSNVECCGCGVAFFETSELPENFLTTPQHACSAHCACINGKMRALHTYRIWTGPMLFLVYACTSPLLKKLVVEKAWLYRLTNFSLHFKLLSFL